MVREASDLSRYVGKKIKEFRIKKGLTQKELGDKVGVKHNTKSGYEMGRVSPEQDSLFALSRALEVRIDDFFPAPEDNSLESLESILKGNENLDVEQIEFLRKLIRQAEALDGQDRSTYFNNIQLAVDIFNQGKK